MMESMEGILRIDRRGGGVLCRPERSLHPGPSDVRVSRRLVREHRLPDGAGIRGSVGEHNELVGIDSVGGLSPEAFRARTPFKQLTVIDPQERFDLGASGEISLRIVDLIAPIGRGTRGLIVSPPKAGKTMLLMGIARAIRASQPNARIIVLLVDERPEEVTHFRRGVQAEVFASSSDHGARDHVDLTELVMAHIRTELECGQEIVVLVDSLTRMGRAYNTIGSGTRRTMSGGVEAGALEGPRRFFGLARNIEGGGSVTIIATVLIDTGSRMDELIFQEFKGTGNSEIVLDRSLAEARIFPAIDVTASGTRKEELLYPPDHVQVINHLRRMLADRRPEAAMRAMLKLIETYPTNEAILRGAPPA